MSHVKQYTELYCISEAFLDDCIMKIVRNSGKSEKE